MSRAPLRVGDAQVLAFRARRGHLLGGGAPDAVAAARAVLGAQAQQPYPGLLALAQRTAGRPSARSLRRLLDEPPRRLVHTWGQRETLHMYDVDDWVLFAAARAEWARAGRRGPMPSQATLAKALRLVEARGVVTRSDLVGVAPASYERALGAELAKYTAAADVPRFVAGRLLWCLSMRGDLCLAGKAGREQAYAARRVWHPDLPWSPPPARQAAAELTRRYLAVSGPATVDDVAHFFKARIADARGWVEVLRRGSELVEVACGSRPGLLALAADVDELRRKPPAAWPARLLPQWDTHLMAHADKSWTVADAAERRLVWRGQAVVAAVVLVRGRVVAEWRQRPRGKTLHVDVVPLSGWRRTQHLTAVRREAETIARHLEMADAAVTTG